MKSKRQSPRHFLAVMPDKSTDFFRGLLIMAVVFLCSCSVQPLTTTAHPPRFRLEIVDHPKEKRFAITLQSLDDRRLFIYRESWPNSSGKLHFGSTWVTLETPSGFLPARDDNFGYALGGHGILIIDPGSQLKGIIPYANFGDPEAIAAFTQRKLHFETSPRLYHGE